MSGRRGQILGLPAPSQHVRWGGAPYLPEVQAMSEFDSINLIPAYGRDYNSAKAAKEAFIADKDFIVSDFLSPFYGKYVNRSQLDSGTRVYIRYNQLTMQTSVIVP
jgi:hypothetical protein